MRLSYKIDDATVAEVLGIQNFKNAESAVLEIVKNSYDSLATKLEISITKNSLIFKDNGVGMNADLIENKWMFIGKSDKPYEEEGRVLAGSKGIGRFALARLGNKILLYSHQKEFKSVSWETDWMSSSLEEGFDDSFRGTRIEVYELRDRWTNKEVDNLRFFLSKVYSSEEMEITILYEDSEYTINNVLNDLHLGVDYLWQIKMTYNASSMQLDLNLSGDEFEDNVADITKTDISHFSQTYNIPDELNEKDPDRINTIQRVGDFSSIMFFVNYPFGEEKNKYHYKHFLQRNKEMNNPQDLDVILYRNAFSIAGYTGDNDWLAFGARSRKSPAAASHNTGSWRVRENQIFGRVDIDKEKNVFLRDMSNRQGLEENDEYRFFTQIILVGISAFERYRQTIIRNISKTTTVEIINRPLIDRVVSDYRQFSKLSVPELKQLSQQIVEIRNEAGQAFKEVKQAEKRYRYDVRLLNLLATLGLRSSSIAHDLDNERNELASNVDNIIEAMKQYGVWDTVCSPENRGIHHRDIPDLLESSNSINKRVVSFIDSVLSNIEKKKFVPSLISIPSILCSIKKQWERDVGKVHIEISGGMNVEFKLSEDLMISIFYNLILNSIQQNEERDAVSINISFFEENGNLFFSYSDDGIGLAPKYIVDPRRILEPMETSRKNGHGLGMWIVYNSILSTGGEVKRIEGKKGFCFEFFLGQNEE